MKGKVCLQLKKHFKTDHLQQRDPKIEAQVATDATLFGKIICQWMIYVMKKSCLSFVKVVPTQKYCFLLLFTPQTIQFLLGFWVMTELFSLHKMIPGDRRMWIWPVLQPYRSWEEGLSPAYENQILWTKSNRLYEEYTDYMHLVLSCPLVTWIGPKK